MLFHRLFLRIFPDICTYVVNDKNVRTIKPNYCHFKPHTKECLTGIVSVCSVPAFDGVIVVDCLVRAVEVVRPVRLR